MKKIVSLFMALTLMAMSLLSLASCGEDSSSSSGSGSESGNSGSSTYYVAAADFFYSDDKGHTYGNGTKEYAVGEPVYMKLKAKVTSNSDVPETVKIKLTIPNITAVDAKYYDGQPITPIYDSVRNVTTYEFTIVAIMNAQEWEFVFQFIPNTEAEVTMLLEFDGKVDSVYDKQNTVLFVAVAPENDGEQND